MATGLVLNKIFAIHLGPSGFAAIGQLQNFIAMVTSFAAGAINTGVTKYTAEYYDQPDRKKQLFQTAGTMTIVGSLFAGVVLVALSSPINTWLFGGENYQEALIFLSACLLMISLNAMLLAVLAGQKEVRRYVIANIASSIIGLVISGTLAWFLGLRGALIALSLGQALALLTTLYFCRGLSWCRLPTFWGRVDKVTLLLLVRYVAMALVAALAVPLTQMLIRSEMISIFGVSHAGYWDAMNKISTIYLSLVTTTLSLYYLPRIAEIKDDSELRKEIGSSFKIIVPLVIFCSIVIFILRAPIVKILFSSEFQVMTELFGWQMIGDVLKIASWLLAYVLIGKAMMKVFIVTEVIFSFSLYIFTICATHEFGFVGVSMAYAFNYLLYLAVMYVVVIEWRLKPRSRLQK